LSSKFTITKFWYENEINSVRS